MLTYAIEERGELPIYDFLYRKIKQDILSGKLSAGEKLPSKRSLARHLQVAVITVENAYAQLLMEGYLYGRGGRSHLAGRKAISWRIRHPPECGAAQNTFGGGHEQAGNDGILREPQSAL